MWDFFLFLSVLKGWGHYIHMQQFVSLEASWAVCGLLAFNHLYNIFVKNDCFWCGPVIQGWNKSCETLLRFHKPNRECEALTGTSNTFRGWYKQQRIICSVLLYPYGKIPLGPITNAAFFVFSIYWNATVNHLCLK